MSTDQSSATPAPVIIAPTEQYFSWLCSMSRFTSFSGTSPSMTYFIRTAVNTRGSPSARSASSSTHAERTLSILSFSPAITSMNEQAPCEMSTICIGPACASLCMPKLLPPISPTISSPVIQRTVPCMLRHNPLRP